MGLEAIANTLESYLDTNWTSTPIAWANVEALDYDSAGQPKLTETDDPFIYFELNNVGSQAVEVTPNCVRYWGLIQIHVYIKEFDGVRPAQQYIDSLNVLFQYKEVSGIRVKNFNYEGPVRLEQGWVLFTCVWPFETEVTLA